MTIGRIKTQHHTNGGAGRLHLLHRGHRLAMVYQVFNSDAMEYTTNVLVFRCVEVEGVQMIVGLGESTETADLMFFKLNTADWTLTSMSANQPLLLTMGP